MPIYSIRSQIKPHLDSILVGKLLKNGFHAVRYDTNGGGFQA